MLSVLPLFAELLATTGGGVGRMGEVVAFGFAS